MAELIRRDILAQIIPWLVEKDILLLLGSRQVGKTSILQLLQEHVKAAPVFYFDLESTFDLSHTVSPEHFIDYLSSI
jgi:predicted AAA+ superfamily ATPase